MLYYAILKSIEEQYREKMNKMKTEIKCKTLHIEKTNTHALSGWCIHSNVVYRDMPDPLKMYQGKDFKEGLWSTLKMS